MGVFHNTIAENESSNNGLAVEGAGAGVGIFDSVPGAQAYGNVVVNNKLKNNGLPGVAMHSHSSEQNPAGVVLYDVVSNDRMIDA